AGPGSIATTGRSATTRAPSRTCPSATARSTTCTRARGPRSRTCAGTGSARAWSPSRGTRWSTRPTPSRPAGTTRRRGTRRSSPGGRGRSDRGAAAQLRDHRRHALGLDVAVQVPAGPPAGVHAPQGDPLLRPALGPGPGLVPLALRGLRPPPRGGRGPPHLPGRARGARPDGGHHPRGPAGGHPARSGGAGVLALLDGARAGPGRAHVRGGGGRRRLRLPGPRPLPAPAGGGVRTLRPRAAVRGG